jgi:hypothetical protein
MSTHRHQVAVGPGRFRDDDGAMRVARSTRSIRFRARTARPHRIHRRATESHFPPWCRAAVRNVGSLYPPRLLDQLRQQVRYRTTACAPKQAYVHWVRAFIRFTACAIRPSCRRPRSRPSSPGWLPSGRCRRPRTSRPVGPAVPLPEGAAASVPWMGDIGRPQRSRRLPVVLSPTRWRAVLAATRSRMPGQGHRWAARAAALRHRHAPARGLRLRVKDIDFERRAIIVREGKGARTAS